MKEVSLKPKYEVGQLVELEPEGSGRQPSYDRIESISGKVWWGKDNKPKPTFSYRLSYFNCDRDEAKIKRVVEEK